MPSAGALVDVPKESRVAIVGDGYGAERQRRRNAGDGVAFRPSRQGRARPLCADASAVQSLARRAAAEGSARQDRTCGLMLRMEDHR